MQAINYVAFVKVICINPVLIECGQWRPAPTGISAEATAGTY